MKTQLDRRLPPQGEESPPRGSLRERRMTAADWFCAGDDPVEDWERMEQVLEGTRYPPLP